MDGLRGEGRPGRISKRVSRCGHGPDAAISAHCTGTAEVIPLGAYALSGQRRGRSSNSVLNTTVLVVRATPGMALMA
jgi:hypothetical protein